jgi:hypothetical protein
MAKPRAPFEIPRELLIRGKRWLVVREHELQPHNGTLDARARNQLSFLEGVTYPSGFKRGPKREIHLAEHDDPRKEAATFLHELLHACSNQVIPMSREEAFIEDVDEPLLRALEQLEWRVK